jgi:hypothetical protein
MFSSRRLSTTMCSNDVKPYKKVDKEQGNGASVSFWFLKGALQVKIWDQSMYL